MENSRKQRLVGAAVLVALAAIFLPALFDRDERVTIDTNTQIPPAPQIEPVNIPKPTRPQPVTPPPPDKLFQPEFIDEPAIDQVSDNVKADGKVSKKVTESELATKTSPSSAVATSNSEPQPDTVLETNSAPQAPGLNEKGVPRAWVVQAASFKSKATADKFTQTLITSGLKAYTQAVNTDKGEFFRVLIGPYIDEQKAIDDKRIIDREHSLRSRVLRFNPIAD